MRIGAERINHSRPWHADDIEKLGDLLFRGKTIPQIARAMGRTQEAVRARASLLGMLPKRVRRGVSGPVSTPFLLRD